MRRFETADFHLRHDNPADEFRARLPANGLKMEIKGAKRQRSRLLTSLGQTLMALA